MNFDFNSMGITLDNIKGFELGFSEFKKALKETGKQTAAIDKQAATDLANLLIREGKIVKGASVIVMYNGNEVTGTVKNTPTVEAKNIPVVSDSFNNKNKFLYVVKSAFVKMADGVAAEGTAN